MKLLDTGVLVVAGAFITWQLGIASPGASTVPEFAPGKVTVVSDQALPTTGEAQADFKTFSTDQNYFGAFALTKDGKPGFSFGYNSLEAAKQDAFVFCAKKHSEPCTIYAIMEPAEPQANLPQPMSAEVAAAFGEYQNTYGYRAFSISDNGSYGMTWEWDGERGARHEALSICSAYSVDEETADQEFTRCRVVDSH